MGGEQSNYVIEVGGYSGDTGDIMNRLGSKQHVHNGMMFTTYDRDNDRALSNCATSFGGGWWYNYCYTVNVNGRNMDRCHRVYLQSEGVYTNVSFTRLMIKGCNCFT